MKCELHKSKNILWQIIKYTLHFKEVLLVDWLLSSTLVDWLLSSTFSRWVNHNCQLVMTKPVGTDMKWYLLESQILTSYNGLFIPYNSIGFRIHPPE